MTTIDIGILDGTALTLTHDATVACGHMLPEGVDGGDAARYHRREARLNAQRQADKLGKAVEIFGSAPGAQDWVVDVVEPSLCD